tara:strand:+ start:5549 stop:6142 length:594 start_codon:yes stop_codon:yes gene_type:complete
MNILMIDNFDSFTYNLVDEFEKRKCKVEVYRNDVPIKTIKKIVKKMKADLIVISPGPSTPKKAGNSMKIVKEFNGKKPIFGVCLGEQSIIECLGGKVGKTFETIHGKPSLIKHNNQGIFKGLKNPFSAGRYHSLSGQKIPNELEISAKSDSGVVMGVSHKKYFLEGVQFHPESFLTPDGGKIIDNVLKMVKSKGVKK